VAAVERFFDDRRTMAETLAREIAAALAEAVGARGRASLVAAGGTTPGTLYDVLSAQDAPWAQVEVTLTDERLVDPASPDSNARLLRERLLKHRAAEARVAPLDEAAVRGLARPFDLVLLGMGEDGHVASLFPGAEGLEAALEPGGEALVAPVRAPGAAGSADRLTLTLPTLLQARRIVLLLTGDAKLATLRRAEAEGDVRKFPVRAVLRQDTAPVEVCWAP
jgi:6-phosphogluconolactonase